MYVMGEQAVYGSNGKLYYLLIPHHLWQKYLYWLWLGYRLHMVYVHSPSLCVCVFLMFTSSVLIC